MSIDPSRQTRDSYDQIAARFLERTRDRSVLRPFMQLFAQALPPGAQVIDLGAGPCHDSAELRALGLSVISVDNSRSMLAVARKDFPGARVQADMRRLPFAAGCIDGVWANASLLHLQRDELVPTLCGLHRLLAPSGVLYVAVKLGSGAAWDRSKYGADAPRWFTYWSERQVDAALQTAGFGAIGAWTREGRHDAWIQRLLRAR